MTVGATLFATTQNGAALAATTLLDATTKQWQRAGGERKQIVRPHWARDPRAKALNASPN